MSSKVPLDAKVYKSKDQTSLSMKDLLEYFTRKGPMRVSDLHIKPGCPPIYRVDGQLERSAMPDLDAETAEALVNSLLSDREVDALRRDGSVDSSCETGTMHFRLNCFRENDGFAAAIRALEHSPTPVEEIGFPNGVWSDILNMQQGLVLVAGITGAGKSTTIASLIDRITHFRPCRIITLEDPIEYRLSSRKAIISQREVGRDTPSFQRGLRDCLREDPEVIFVGEMRDAESTAWTLTAAETGHLVFSTLHTRDARGTVTRVMDMFPASRQSEVSSQLSLGLSYVICQKLLPRSDGQGRLVAMEILHNTYSVANLIRNGKVEQIYSQPQTRTRDGPQERMITLERSLAMLVGAGKVEPREAEMWANDRNSFLDELKRLRYRR